MHYLQSKIISNMFKINVPKYEQLSVQNIFYLHNKYLLFFNVVVVVGMYVCGLGVGWRIISDVTVVTYADIGLWSLLYNRGE